MSCVRIVPARQWRCGIFSLAVIAAISSTSGTDAQARFRRHRDTGYEPPYAAIVVDANSGNVLHTANADSLRHPASLTKIMTLYLLFEQLETGKLKLNTSMHVSAHAASQSPTKLGLTPGQTIEVEDAIKAVVTKSANDAAVVIAETIGGDESSFAKMMTRKARALGMTRTTYVNASGLPDDDQLTTARDQALLGRAIQERFPRQYHYFSTEQFHYHGVAMRNHNHLLGQVTGVDGIKTGYTQASGFNLVTSVHRGNRFIVAVVLGGTSSGSRDERMRELIEAHINEASPRHTAAMIAEAREAPAPSSSKLKVAAQQPPARQAASEAIQHTTSSAPDTHPDPAPTITVTPVAVAARQAPSPSIPGPQLGSGEVIQPIPVKTISVRSSIPQTAGTALFTSPTPQSATPPESLALALAPEPEPQPSLSLPSSSPASLSVVTIAPLPPPPPAREDALALAIPQTRTAVASADIGTLAAAATDHAAAPDREIIPPAAAPQSQPEIAPHMARPGGWMIQVGTFDDENQAQQRLRAARSMANTLLVKADPFTERVTKEAKGFYRARFAGLDKDRAEAACHYFKHHNIACMTLKN